MILSKKLIIIFVVLAAVVSGLFVANSVAYGAPLSSRQIELIRNNCVSAKTTLNQLHVSDALLRVNIGQSYESIATKLMDGFNGRLSRNGYSSLEFVTLTSQYRHKLDVFRASYKKYEEQMTRTTAIDCYSRSVDFYDAVNLVSSYRSEVHDDVDALNAYINQYSLAVDEFEKNYKTASGGGTN
jgi:hypothetical protein